MAGIYVVQQTSTRSLSGLKLLHFAYITAGRGKVWPGPLRLAWPSMAKNPLGWYRIGGKIC
jgi:hypothetical protein